MNNAGSAIETKSSNLTLSSPLQLDSGSITSTGGTLSFAGGLTLGSGGTLGVAGSTLSVNATLDLSAGTLSSNTSSVLKLQAPTTLTSSNPVSFGAVSFEGNVLTLGSSSTHLKITDTPLSLGGIPLETGPGSLTLSGALSLSNQEKINSSGGSITLESGGSVAGGSTLSLPNTTLVLQSPLSIASSTLKTSNTTFTTNSNALTLSGSSNLYIEGAQDLSGVVPDSTSVLRLTGDTTLNGSNALSVTLLSLRIML
jgi:filamentous hemagglutinin